MTLTLTPKAALIGRRGFATLEMLIAMTLMVIVIASVLPLVSGGQTVPLSSQMSQMALYQAQGQMENLRALAQSDFFNPILNPGNTATTTITSVGDFSKQLTVKAASGGQQVSLSTIITNWQAALGGSACGQSLTGDWTAPQIYGYVDFANSSGATSVQVRGTRAYVTSDPNSATTDDLYVIDVSNASPTTTTLPVLGHLNTSYGLTDVRVVGNYAYVAVDSTAYQLLVIDISDPAHLGAGSIIKKIDVTPTKDTAYGNTLAYYNHKLFLGLTKSLGAELHVFDLIDPANPVEIDSYETAGAINAITIKNNTMYLATSGQKEIIALDTTNLAFTDGYTSATLSGQSLAEDGNNTLYFGRIGGIGNPKLMAFNKTNLSAPIWTMNMNSQSGVYTINLRGNLLFMTTADLSDGLQIWDVSGGSPVRYDTKPLNIQQGMPAGSTCVGNFLYVAQKNNRALQIIGPKP